jgi:hypothetical protein
MLHSHSGGHGDGHLVYGTKIHDRLTQSMLGLQGKPVYALYAPRTTRPCSPEPAGSSIRLPALAPKTRL